MDLESPAAAPAAAAPGRTVCVMRRLSRYYFAIKKGTKAGRTHVKGHGFLSFVMSHVGEEEKEEAQGRAVKGEEWAVGRACKML